MNPVLNSRVAMIKSSLKWENLPDTMHFWWLPDTKQEWTKLSYKKREEYYKLHKKILANSIRELLKN